MEFIKSIQLTDSSIKIIDQRELPHRLIYREINSINSLIEAIKSLRIRGAPLIGIAAAYGVFLEVKRLQKRGGNNFKDTLLQTVEKLRSSRPTAYNLFFTLERMERIIIESHSFNEAQRRISEEVERLGREEIDRCEQMSDYGMELVPENAGVLTICNTGFLATLGRGTALGVVYKAHKIARIRKVYVCETRPLLQGARLTMWELKRMKIPAVLIVDSNSSYLMKRGDIDIVLTGADRIALNGDTANKIGTLQLAISANFFDIPFYVVAPTSSFDFEIRTAEEITIEERSGEEIVTIQGKRIAPEGTVSLNYAFDITPGSLITAFVTEKGILKPPYEKSIPNLLKR